MRLSSGLEFRRPPEFAADLAIRGFRTTLQLRSSRLEIWWYSPVAFLFFELRRPSNAARASLLAVLVLAPIGFVASITASSPICLLLLECFPIPLSPSLDQS